VPPVLKRYFVDNLVILKICKNNKAILTKSEWLYYLVLICSAVSTMPCCLDPLTTAAF